MKRFVIILLALLSGLTVPQAVAAAAGAGDARVAVAPLATRSAQAGDEVQVQRPEPAFGLIDRPGSDRPEAGFAPAAPTIRFGDRARE